ncbi:hypothetical protein IAU59_004898 [Kwoniella sp. CBS 9459]
MDQPADFCLEYTFRVAYLQDLIQRPSHGSRAIEKDQLVQNAAAGPSKRAHDGPSSFFAFDLGSLINRDSTKSPKYPEKLLKLLDTNLQRIAMGQEPKYADQRFRRTVARFWSSTWPDKMFQRQMKESRKVEDLILAFVTTATKALQKDEELVEGGWKWELGVQVSLFLELLSQSLAAIGPVSPEISSRLESYRARLQESSSQKPSSKPVVNNEREEEESVTVGRLSQRDEDEGAAVNVVGQLWGLDRIDIRTRIDRIRGSCTEQAALDDLKSCLKSLNTSSPYPYSPEDFSDQAHWTSWRSSEVSTLSQMMLAMMQINPALTQSSDRTSAQDMATQLESTHLEKPARAFTFIPPDSADLYRALLTRCLDRDLEILKTLPEDEDVSLGILSPEHAALLGECGARWRLPLPFRGQLFLKAILDKHVKGEVPAACVLEATGMLQRIQEEWPLSAWPISDQILERRNICFLDNIAAGLHTGEGYHSMEFLEAVEDWQMLELPSASQDGMKSIVARIADSVRSQAFSSYIGYAAEQLDLEGSKTSAFATHMATWIEKEAKKLDRKFKSPITRDLDVVPLVLRQQLTLWSRDLEDTVQLLLAEAPGDHLEELFSLYRRASKLAMMGEAFLNEGDHAIRFLLASLFSPVIHFWLNQTAGKTKGWTEQALAVDKFEPSSQNGPSSSVTDLFDSFRSAVSFLMELKWPDEQQLAVFATHLAKIISLAINEYCFSMERLFTEDMKQVDTSQTAAQEKAWLEKAKSTLASLQGERKIQAFFNFTPESCVKLNNIEVARQQLDRLYDQMRVDDLSAYEPSTSIAPERPQTFLFTVKIVLAEGLILDNPSKAPDSFVILSDEHGNRFAKTRTIHDDPDPRWDESFDIPVKGNAWFMATVRHRNLSGKHDLLGRAYLRLDPSQYVDLMSKDVLLPLDSRGHLLLRVSMEGERDDIQYHFGRAFRWLKRTESDMVRIFVDKSVLKPIVSGPLDYNEAFGKLSAAYRSALGTPEYSIPPTKEEKRRGPSDADIETAIHPLFDYLDTNNHTLASTLSPDAMRMVMTKLWKQILMTIEALIVPPLSDKPSRMRALSDGELDIALKWLKFLRDFFYVGGDASGVPLSVLQNAKFSEILSVRIYYDWSTDDLMEECIRGFQSTLRHRALKPSKTLASQRNLGTIRARKSAKRAVPNTAGNTEMIMRILRMRQGTQEFLAQQIQTLSVVKLENPKKGRSLTARR